jgi:DNA-binding transcriptional regulator YhcF (GntR family)
MIEEAKSRLALEQIAAFLESMKRLGYEKEQVLALIECAGS